MKENLKVPSFKTLRSCPMCGRILAHWRLHKHIHLEPWRMRNEVMVEIRKEYPDWVHQEGACERCWESYRGVVRVTRFMDSFKLPKHWRRQVEVA